MKLDAIPEHSVKGVLSMLETVKNDPWKKAVRFSPDLFPGHGEGFFGKEVKVAKVPDQFTQAGLYQLQKYRFVDGPDGKRARLIRFKDKTWGLPGSYDEALWLIESTRRLFEVRSKNLGYTYAPQELLDYDTFGYKRVRTHDGFVIVQSDKLESPALFPSEQFWLIYRIMKKGESQRAFREKVDLWVRDNCLLSTNEQRSPWTYQSINFIWKPTNKLYRGVGFSKTNHPDTFVSTIGYGLAAVKAVADVSKQLMTDHSPGTLLEMIEGGDE